MVSEARYVALASGPSSASCSRQPSASSSLSSSPLQRATATLYAASAFDDEPYELSEKASWSAGAPLGGDEHERRGWSACVHRGKTTLLVGVCVVLALMLLLRDGAASATAPATTAAVANTTSAVSAPAVEAPAYRLEDDMVLITKVGSATVHKRLLIHLAEQARSHMYTPNHLYVSDYPLTLGNITFYDALANVTPTIAALPEFATLRTELHTLLESNQNLDDAATKDAGWKLDKYKFLPAVAEAWRRWPARKWYVMVEADTFVFWHELVKWLSTLNEGQQLMLGHPSFCDYDGQSTMFTHGGSGLVLSRALVEASFGADAEFEHHQDALIQASAFGDALLSKSLYDAPGVTLTELSPEGEERFNSDPPRVLKFTRGTWCKPILSFHHITPTDAAHLYDFARRLDPLLPANDTVRWADVWGEFIPRFLKHAMDAVGRFHADHDAPFLDAQGAEPGEVTVKAWQAFEEWDSETTDVVTRSVEECREMCRDAPGCLMWEWRKKGDGWPEQDWGKHERDGVWGKCRYTSEFLRIGVTKPNTHDELTTGWMGTRIDGWRREQPCSGRTGLNAYD
ncbi:conserved hypothetical protein [Sporisorium reilianum SRZ2]|uniref:N-acetylgalactosaminide beta-1,3-galactosyltransferase n=1 Tax=Sporisorium reilianum (strain SRZ2) TaxID=999809 RepID=E6ZM15_SPORE|nr:conserved hypothetical protein [Sporisorium reilianum SRZ2]